MSSTLILFGQLGRAAHSGKDKSLTSLTSPVSAALWKIEAQLRQAFGRRGGSPSGMAIKLPRENSAEGGRGIGARAVGLDAPAGSPSHLLLPAGPSLAVTGWTMFERNFGMAVAPLHED